MSARLPSQVSIHCHLFSRRHTTAAERALNVKTNKAGNGREALSSNHCSRGKSVSTKYSEPLSVFLPTLFGTKSACDVLCHMWLVCHYYVFPLYLTYGTIFRIHLLRYKSSILIFSTKFYLKYLSF